jgi:hypothetical protein
MTIGSLLLEECSVITHKEAKKNNEIPLLLVVDHKAARFAGLFEL